MKPTPALLAALAFGCAGLHAAGDAATEFQSRVQPILKTYCTKCHGPEKQKAKVNVSGARTLDQLAAERDLWFRVLDQIESGAMPPEDEKQPAKLERETLAAWIRGEFSGMLLAKQREEGRGKLRRLTRNEYANTVQDIFGIRPPVGLELPGDGRVDGYDKVSAALPLAASGAAGYFKMAEEILKWVLKPQGPAASAPAASRTVRAAAMESGQASGHTLRLDDGTMVSFNSDTTSGRLDYKGTRIPGIHRLRISVHGYQTDKPMAFGIYAGHTSAYPQILELLQVLEAPPGKPAVIETEVYLRTRGLNDLFPGSDNLRLIPFGLGVQVPKGAQAGKCRGPGLAVQWVDIEEPELPLPGDRWLTADFPEALNEELRSPRKVIFGKAATRAQQPKSVTREQFIEVMQTTFKRVGARFYRRDLHAPELGAIMADLAQQLDDGEPLASAFIDQIIAMMTSPDFLCVVEAPGQLPDFALASRLSHFLWNSTPDEPLLDVARQGQLRDPQVLAAQTERLLKDPKAERFVSDFTDQWLGLGGIDDTTPDSKLYPEYAKHDLLKRSSVLETRAFFRRILGENLSVRDFAAPSWALVNEALATHYGLADVAGLALQKVNLPASTPYGGFWTQSAVLKVTANGTYTSPVKRGRWVSERLLGIPIPPPPPDVPAVDPDTRGAKTLREQLALHSKEGSCAGCHAKFDPYGFALESFDVTGAFRKNYRVVDPEVVALPPDKRKGLQTWRDGLPVDCSGKTPDGRAFAGIAELRQMLAKNPEQLARGVTRHLVTYATGTPPTRIDEPAIEAIVKNAAPGDYGLRSLVHAVVQSELFRSK